MVNLKADILKTFYNKEKGTVSELENLVGQFFLLCEQYDVELNKTAVSPMIKDGAGLHTITRDDINRIFIPCQTYFIYIRLIVRTKKLWQKSPLVLKKIEIVESPFRKKYNCNHVSVY